MLGDIYYTSCTKNVTGWVNRRKTAKNRCPIFPTKNMETEEREENNKVGRLVISSHLISFRKETLQGFGKITVKHSPGLKKQFTFHQEVRFHYLFPLALSLISLWTTFCLPKTFIYKNHLVNWLCSWWAEHRGQIREPFMPTGKCS